MITNFNNKLTITGLNLLDEYSNIHYLDIEIRDIKYIKINDIKYGIGEYDALDNVDLHTIQEIMYSNNSFKYVIIRLKNNKIHCDYDYSIISMNNINFIKKMYFIKNKQKTYKEFKLIILRNKINKICEY